MHGGQPGYCVILFFLVYDAFSYVKSIKKVSIESARVLVRCVNE